MNNKPIYSSSLLRFISSFDIDPNNTVITPTALDSAEFVSMFYTPQLRVSKLASKVSEELDTGVIAKNELPNKDSFMYKLQTSDLKETKPYVYQLAKVVMLECFSIVYAIKHENKLLKYLEKEDIRTARTNLKYILDSLGKDQKYMGMTEDINKLDISLGYIQAQIPVIRGEMNV